MPIVKMEDLDGNRRRITLTTRDQVDLRLEEDAVGIYVDEMEVGRLWFHCGMESDSPPANCRLVARLTKALINGEARRFRRHGLGTEAVSFFLEYTGYALDLSGEDSSPGGDGMINQFLASLRRRRASGEL